MSQDSVSCGAMIVWAWSKYPQRVHMRRKGYSQSGGQLRFDPSVDQFNLAREKVRDILNFRPKSGQADRSGDSSQRAGESGQGDQVKENEAAMLGLN
jgi:hypothetical protein